MAGLVCGVCGGLLSNPYSLPCGHTFCLRPCLLSSVSATTSRCVHCRATFDVAELRPNYAILMQLSQLPRWDEEQQHNPNQNRQENQKQASRQDQALKHQVESNDSGPLTSLFRKISFAKDEADQEGNVFQSSCQHENEEDCSVVPDATTANQVLIGGIPARTSRKVLKDYFSRYGTVKTCFISPHNSFGSVTFESGESVRNVISQPIHFIRGAKVTVKEHIVANGHDTSKPQSAKETANRWSIRFPLLSPFSSPTVPSQVPEPPLEERHGIFVRGISHTTTVDSLKAALSKLGPVRKADISAKRGFAVVVFERPETALLATSAQWYIIDGKLAEIRPFIPNKLTRKFTDSRNPPYAVGAQQVQEQPSNRRKEGKKTSMGAKCAREKSFLPAPCSTCGTPVEAELLDFCHHCHCEICLQCLENHRNYCVLMLNAKLSDLSHHLPVLKSKSPALKTEKKAKDRLIEALDAVVLQLNLAANTAVDLAIAKLETVHEVDKKMIDPIARRIKDLFDKVAKVEDLYASLEETANLQEMMAKQEWLTNIILGIESLEGMITNLPPLPITLVHPSDLITKIDQLLSNFSLFIPDGQMVPLTAPTLVQYRWQME